MAPPQFTVQPERTPPQASLRPTATAAPSPMAGGAQTQAPPGLPVSAAGGNGNSNVTSGCLDADWVRAVNARVVGVFHYPRRAALLGITGQVNLRFTVESNGLFSALELAKSSGSYTLDSNAMFMMRRAQPLPAIPARMHVPHVTGLLMILFGQQSAGLRTPLLTCN